MLWLKFELLRYVIKYSSEKGQQQKYKHLTLNDLYLTIPFSLLVPTPSKAKFFNISQPMAPHPT
jgi:hypothetical protein